MSVVHLIYREKYYETQAKDCEFSRLSMQETGRPGVPIPDARSNRKSAGLNRPGTWRPSALP